MASNRIVDHTDAACGLVRILATELGICLKSLPGTPQGLRLHELIEYHEKKFSDYDAVQAARITRNRIEHAEAGITFTEVAVQRTSATFERALQDIIPYCQEPVRSEMESRYPPPNLPRQPAPDSQEAPSPDSLHESDSPDQPIPEAAPPAPTLQSTTPPPAPNPDLGLSSPAFSYVRRFSMISAFILGALIIGFLFYFANRSGATGGVLTGVQSKDHPETTATTAASVKDLGPIATNASQVKAGNGKPGSSEQSQPADHTAGPSVGNGQAKADIAPSMQAQTALTQDVKGFSVTLNSCRMQTGTMTCALRVINNRGDRPLGIVNGASRLIDASGREYSSDKVRLGRSTAQIPGSIASNQFVTGIPIAAEIVFDRILSPTEFALLDIAALGDGDTGEVKFRFRADLTSLANGKEQGNVSAASQSPPTQLPATQEEAGYAVTLNSCKIQASSLVCTLQVVNKRGGRSFGIVNGASRIIDTSGYEYYSDKVRLGRSLANINASIASNDLVSGIPVAAEIDFDNVPSDLTGIALLEVAASGGSADLNRLRFRFTSIPVLR